MVVMSMVWKPRFTYRILVAGDSWETLGRLITHQNIKYSVRREIDRSG